MFVILSERGPRRTLQPGGGESKDLLLYLFLLLFLHLFLLLSLHLFLLLFLLFSLLVILSERGPRRSLQPGGGESKDLLLYLSLLLFLLVILSDPERSKGS